MILTAEFVPIRSHFVAIFATLFMILFSFGNTFLASSYIASDLGADQTVSVFTASFFGLGTALTVPLGKPLIARVGLGYTFLGCLFATTIMTFSCAFATNFPIHLFQRFCDGAFVGPLFAALRFFLTTYTPPEKGLKAIALFVSILTVSPVIGAAFGGVLAYEYNWRWIYYFSLIPYGLLSLFYFFGFRHTYITCPREKFDGIGYFFFFVGVGLLSFVAMTVQYFDWYRCVFLVWATIIGIPCFLFYIFWSLYHPSPILDLRMLKSYPFTFAMINLAIFVGTYFGMVILLSLWLKLYVNYDPYWIGIIVGIMAVAGLFPWLVIEDRMRKIDHRIFIFIGVTLFAISCFHTSTFDVDIDFPRIVISRVFAGFGLAICLPSIFLISVESIPPEKSLDMIQMFQFVRNLAAALGASTFDIVWQRRQIFFHERLGEKINVFSRATADFFERVRTYNTPGDPNAQLGYFLQRQATALGLEDTFWLMSWILVGLLVFCLGSAWAKFSKQ
jgi:DHA2 family multidrug resistance protein